MARVKFLFPAWMTVTLGVLVSPEKWWKSICGSVLRTAFTRPVLPGATAPCSASPWRSSLWLRTVRTVRFYQSAYAACGLMSLDERCELRSNHGDVKYTGSSWGMRAASPYRLHGWSTYCCPGRMEITETGPIKKIILF